MTRRMAAHGSGVTETARARAQQGLLSRTGKPSKKDDLIKRPKGNQTTISVRLQGQNEKKKKK